MNKTAGVAAPTETVTFYPELTVAQKQRYAHLRGIYSDDNTLLKLTLLIEPKGDNNWKSVNDKIDAIKKGDYKHQMYHDALYENFELGKEYTSEDIICTVGIVQREQGLPTYVSSLKKNCESDFFKLFIFHTLVKEICCAGNTEGAPKLKRSILGYLPVFKLKPDE